MAYTTPADRYTIAEAAAELDTLSEMLGAANDSAVLAEVRGRLSAVLASLTPVEAAVPDEDPYMWDDPTA